MRNRLSALITNYRVENISDIKALAFYYKV